MSNKWRLWILLGIGFLIFPAYDPANLYQYPLDNYYALAGTFGELRPGHFHSGIDIKTGGKTGAKVYATQEGYLYRIKVSPYGYGKALYLRHADGRFSVYAHLSRFLPEVEAFVEARQARDEQFEQEIYLEPNQFQFKKGELIAYSGSSGTSYGPHLHFEIRDPAERIMNALPFFKDLIKDDIPPIVKKLAFEPIDPDSRVNGSFEKLILRPGGANGKYRLAEPIGIQGRVGLEYLALDKLNAAPNRCGINYAQLFLDDELLFALELEKFAFDKTHHINQHIDYGHYQRKGERFQKAYLDIGNELSAYRELRGRGFLELEDDSLHSLRLELADGFGNTTVVEGKVQRKAPPQLPAGKSLSGGATPDPSFRIKRNVLVVTAKNPTDSWLEGLSFSSSLGNRHKLLPAYGDEQQLTYLLPLQGAQLPTQVFDPGGNLLFETGLQALIQPGENKLVAFEQVQAFFPYAALFQPAPLSIRKLDAPATAWSAAYQVGDPDIPLKEGFWLSFEPQWPDSLKEKLVIAQKTSRGWRFCGNHWGDDGKLYAQAEEFGEFCVMVDSTGPELSPANFSDGGTFSAGQQFLRLRTQDTFSGIASRSIRGTLDGQWVPFEYSYKYDWIRWQWKKRPAPGKHELEIYLEDQAGNVTRKRYAISF
jgi:murein DD-endopeptidase MepM/ murein hydrolase activator NlpD